MLKQAIPLIVVILVGSTSGENMKRTILGVGEWYYKILMSLGACKDRLLFSEQQIWGRVRMNRVFDIFYRSENDYYKVSKVEIKLVVNDSDVMADSEEGVGHAKFTATVYLPLNTLVIFYSLKIFTCNVPIVQHENNVEVSVNDEDQNGDSFD